MEKSPMVSLRLVVLLSAVLVAFESVLMSGTLVAQTVAPTSFVESVPARTLFAVTKIYQGQQPQPVEIHEIAMVDGVVYDFPADRDQPWTVFDLPQSQVVLLDRKHQQRTSISTEELIRLTAQADSAITDPIQRSRFGMDAEVQVLDENRFELSYDQTHYRVQASSPSQPTWAIQYSQFVDWACRLNIARPRGVPPFARMRINEVVSRAGLFPQRIDVEMTRSIGEDATAVLVRLNSQTTLSPEIGRQTQSRIDETHSMRVLFKEIPWDEYEH